MQKLVDQVQRDKNDTKNREKLKILQEKSQRINAVTNERKRKEETDKLERLDRE